MRAKYAFSFSVLFLLCQSIYAAPTAEELASARNKGLAYLIQQQNGDGSYSVGKSQFISTSETIRAFAKNSVSGVVRDRSLSWLLNAEANNPDFIARRLHVIIDIGLSANDVAQSLNRSRKRHYSSIATWGSYNSQATIIDSALVYRVLNLAIPLGDWDSEEGITYNKWGASEYYHRTRNNLPDGDGGWGYSLDIEYGNSANTKSNIQSESAVIPTSYVILGLTSAIPGHSSNIQHVLKSANWLIAQQRPNGGFGDGDTATSFETAIVARALGYAKNLTDAPESYLAAYNNALQYLVNTQAQDGSWSGGEFAVAASVLALYEDQQVLVDTDSDGIPDEIELELGTNPQEYDLDFLEKGNGSNYSDAFLGSRVEQHLINDSLSIVLTSASGATKILSGRLPKGLSHNESTRSISGAPTEEGVFPISYQHIDLNSNKSIGSLYLHVTSELGRDIDQDGIPTYFEHEYGLNAYSSADAHLDLDSDGLSNLQEFQLGYLPNMEDSDSDGLPDIWEHTNGQADPNADPDNDQLTNIQELAYNADPNNPDTDKDNMLDGEEVFVGRNPLVNEPVIIVIISTLLN